MYDKCTINICVCVFSTHTIETAIINYSNDIYIYIYTHMDEVCNKHQSYKKRKTIWKIEFTCFYYKDNFIRNEILFSKK